MHKSSRRQPIARQLLPRKCCVRLMSRLRNWVRGCWGDLPLHPCVRTWKYLVHWSWEILCYLHLVPFLVSSKTHPSLVFCLLEVVVSLKSLPPKLDVEPFSAFNLGSLQLRVISCNGEASSSQDSSCMSPSRNRFHVCSSWGILLSQHT